MFSLLQMSLMHLISSEYYMNLHFLFFILLRRLDGMIIKSFIHVSKFPLAFFLDWEGGGFQLLL